MSKGTLWNPKPCGNKHTLKKTSSLKNCVVKNKASKKCQCSRLEKMKTLKKSSHRHKKSNFSDRSVSNNDRLSLTKPGAPLKIPSKKVTKQVTIPAPKKIRDCASKPMNGCDGLKGYMRSYHTPANIMYSQKDLKFRAKKTFFSVSAQFCASKCPPASDKTGKDFPSSKPHKRADGCSTGSSAECPPGSGKTGEKSPPTNCTPRTGGTGIGSAGSGSTCLATSSPSSSKCPAGSGKVKEKLLPAKYDAGRNLANKYLSSYLADCRSQRNRNQSKKISSGEKIPAAKSGTIDGKSKDSYLADCRSRRNRIKSKKCRADEKKPPVKRGTSDGGSEGSYLSDCRTPRNRIKSKKCRADNKKPPVKSGASDGGSEGSYLADCRSRRNRIKPKKCREGEKKPPAKRGAKQGGAGESYLADCRSRRNRIKGRPGQVSTSRSTSGCRPSFRGRCSRKTNSATTTSSKPPPRSGKNGKNLPPASCPPKGKSS
ncbi:uncharacterized protein LOC113507485 isoform X2 [Trichoplusia ni]|uniref:Uncharacterized protein LOC113507485 isoform X2 n=1 Tax=Trichoplusia ni TaxID=7111 RepID=A0A7E5X0C6_TRINI|nr:uncharacterized protein LOC113507485 isoform X2 [Trichoplusia ni]